MNKSTDPQHVPVFQLIWRILTIREKRHLLVIWLLILIGMVLETFSISLIVPFMSLLSQDGYQADIPLIGSYVNDVPTVHVLVYAMIIFATVFVLKNIFLFFSTLVQRRFSFATSARISRDTFSGYLRQPYEFHLEKNSAVLIRNVENATLIVGGGLDPYLILLTDGLVALGLFALLLFIEPLGTFCILALFGGSALIFQRITRGRIASWGQKRKFHSEKVLQHLQQGLNGVKEIKILGRELKFLKVHDEHLLLRMEADKSYAMLQAVPRLFFEAVAVIGLAVLVILMVVSGTTIEDVLPKLGLFAATAFRIMPSIGRLIASAQTITFSRAPIQAVFSDLELVSPSEPRVSKPLKIDSNVTVRNVSFQYANAEKNTLVDVSIEVPRGEAIGIVGLSGAGKSTLVDVILGLLVPSSGAVEVDGRSISTNVSGWQQCVGYVPQTIYLVDDSVRNNVAFGVPEREIDDLAVQRALHAAQLDEFVQSLPSGIDTIVGERGVRLSGGQRQRIGIARALYHDPEVLVLDEATSSLDTETERGVMDAVRDLLGSKTIIIVAHRVSTVSYCSRVYRMEDGRVVGSGSPEVMTGSGESA
ncbi:MAG: ABC transporter ATP-binding protein [Actinobacteria bacterium]|nr:ABC transporter ATP-binding protein [Actinomycetota bacterium]